jgi:hypothetical protein
MAGGLDLAILEDLGEADKLGLEGTPSIIVARLTKTGAVPVQALTGVKPIESYDSAIAIASGSGYNNR